MCSAVSSQQCFRFEDFRTYFAFTWRNRGNNVTSSVFLQQFYAVEGNSACLALMQNDLLINVFGLFIGLLLLIFIIIVLKIVTSYVSIIAVLYRVQIQNDCIVECHLIFEFLFADLRQYPELVSDFQFTATIFTNPLRESIVFRYLRKFSINQTLCKDETMNKWTKKTKPRWF